MSDEARFYILSVKWSEGRECLTWWGPNLSGYSMFLENAGVYSQADVEKHSLNDDRAMAIPAEVVRSLARTTVHSNYYNAIIASRMPLKVTP